jgi:uncharacterized SAM-binding protein YcdF (DUF218 family)
MTFKKFFKILFWAHLIVLLVMTMDFCSYSTRTSRKLLEESKSKSFDVVIVPGVPFEDGQWSKIMKARVYWSKYLYDKGIAKNIMYSGSAVYSPYVEAEIMALYGQAIGIDKDNILTENKAEHSTENLYYSYHKAKNMGFKTIALASDPFQSKMLSSFAKEKLSNDVTFLPIVFDTLKTLEPTMTDPAIDYKSLLVKNFVALPKRESWWKRIHGTMGDNIDTTIYLKAK